MVRGNVFRIAAVAVVVTLAVADGGFTRTRHSVFLKSATENENFTQVTLPLYQGTSGADTVWYVITDASRRDVARRLRVNFAPKLANTTGGRGSQLANGSPRSLNFTATVDFGPNRCISQGDYGECARAPFLPFGPVCFQEGAVGNAGYSPLVELPDGTVLNASHIANSTGQQDRAVINANGTVTLDESVGRAFGQLVYYVSLDAGGSLGAVVENVTNAPQLAQTPQDVAGENTSHLSSRAGIIAFVNGQNGLDNSNRQGLNSTILDRPARAGCGLDTETEPVPINILQFVPDPRIDPGFPQYSPLWDVHFTKWQVPYDERFLQDDFEEVRHNPNITNQNNGPFGPAGPAGIGNCPIISIDEVRGNDDDDDDDDEDDDD